MECDGGVLSLSARHTCLHFPSLKKKTPNANTVLYCMLQNWLKSGKPEWEKKKQNAKMKMLVPVVQAPASP